MFSAARTSASSENRYVDVDGPCLEHTAPLADPLPLQLIVFFSKSLLRHPLARSNLEEMEGDTIFQRYIPDAHPENLVAPEQIRRHVLCSGQVYYQLLQEREKRGINDIAISRVEQISPLPYDLLTPHLDKYPNADLVWAQEEVSSPYSHFPNPLLPPINC